jgi:transcription elongation factor GreA
VSMTHDNTANVTWLTQEAFDRLKAEHDQLVAQRPVVAAEINERREEGDLRENGGYHAAREEQGKQEARIRQLEDLLRTARVGDAPTTAGVAGPGMVVTVRFDDDAESEQFLIGSREEIATADIQVYSAQSPLGKALTGARVGETRQYETPTGATIKVNVLKAEPYSG